MTCPTTEAELGALANQLISGRTDGPASAADLDELRAAIANGDDPMGTDFVRLRSPENRRVRGAVYTPRAIVAAMVAWARAEPGPPPARIVDAGSGSGRFLLAAARAFPGAQLAAVEIDPLAVTLLRANAVAAGFADRLTVHQGDYRTFAPPEIEGRTLFIGNPPYVRHHQIPEAAKEWFAETAARLGIRASKLAGLHIHFFLRTREIAKRGDFGVFITASEWLDVNYGAVLRHLLTDGLGGTSLQVLDATTHPFEGAMTTGAITCFRVGNRPKTFTVRTVADLDHLMPLSEGKAVAWSTVARASRWSTLIRPAARKPAGVIELGELFRVHRGQVTGCNAAWIAGPCAARLPARFLQPSITRAREIFACDAVLRSNAHLRRVIDLPVDLDELTAAERREVGRFLTWAKSLGADRTYIATHRRAWWAVELHEPPPILCTYMARQPPAFVLNHAKVRLLNIAHGLYPVQPVAEQDLAVIAGYLRQTADMAEGRTYAGGLVKLEPGDVERLHIPAPGALQFATDRQPCRHRQHRGYRLCEPRGDTGATPAIAESRGRPECCKLNHQAHRHQWSDRHRVPVRSGAAGAGGQPPGVG